MPNLPSIRGLTSFFSQLPLGILNPNPSTYSQSPSQGVISTGAPTCPIDSPLSCHNSTVAPESCCFIYPGGQLLSTQFWDTSPSVGPDDSWTLHGLWPDLCDGTYPTYCTSAPQYYNITTLLSTLSPTLLSTMEKYWLPNSGTLEHFWEHEWNKHGTCINTLSPSCYSSYSPGQEVIDFLQRAVDVFQGLDTYKALASAGITPSTTKTYTSVEILEALKGVNGEDVQIVCDGQKRLNQAWYSFNVKGSLQTGEFVATAPVGKTGTSCPATGIKYVPK